MQCQELPNTLGEQCTNKPIHYSCLSSHQEWTMQLLQHKPSKQCQAPSGPSTVKIESTQKTAMKAILGTFSTTATSALQIETFLPPMHLHLRNKVLQLWTTMQTVPETHPINAAIRRTSMSRSKEPHHPTQIPSKSISIVRVDNRNDQTASSPTMVDSALYN